jgi:hypothetical protein
MAPLPFLQRREISLIFCKKAHSRLSAGECPDLEHFWHFGQKTHRVTVVTDPKHAIGSSSPHSLSFLASRPSTKHSIHIVNWSVILSPLSRDSVTALRMEGSGGEYIISMALDYSLVDRLEMQLTCPCR